MADGRNYGQQNLWQLEKSTYKREAHPSVWGNGLIKGENKLKLIKYTESYKVFGG